MKKTAVFFGLMIVLFGGTVGYFSYLATLREVTEVNVKFTTPPRFLESTLVNKLLTQNSTTQSKELKESLDLNMLETQLNSIPGVKKAEVFRFPKGALAVEITERKPKFIVETNQRYYSDASGAIFTFQNIDTLRLPVFKTDSLETLTSTADLIVKLTKDTLLESELETLYLENHEYILDMRSFPFQVVLGDSTQLKNKLEKLKIFCAFQTSQDSLIDFDKINLSYKNQVVATTH